MSLYTRLTHQQGRSPNFAVRSLGVCAIAASRRDPLLTGLLRQ